MFQRTSKELTPLRLRSMLEACHDPADKARCALELLRAFGGSDSGYLFTAREDGLEMVASTPGSVPPPDLVEGVDRFWQDTLRTYEDNARTLDLRQPPPPPSEPPEPPQWRGSDGELYHRLLLRMRQAGHVVAVGVAVLRQRPNTGLLVLDPGQMRELVQGLSRLPGVSTVRL